VGKKTPPIITIGTLLTAASTAFGGAWGRGSTAVGGSAVVAFARVPFNFVARDTQYVFCVLVNEHTTQYG
jgi:hypothetical protein